VHACAVADKNDFVERNLQTFENMRTASDMITRQMAGPPCAVLFNVILIISCQLYRYIYICTPYTRILIMDIFILITFLVVPNKKILFAVWRLKWVATLPLGDINTEAWSSGMGVGHGANNPTL
jgi:hypothetical protein